MKTLLLILLALTLTAVSCGGKDGGGSSSSSFSNALSTQTGYLNTNSQTPIEVGGKAYPVSTSQNDALIRQALQQAQMQGIQPLNVNGVWKYRARFTGQLYNPYATTNGNYGAYTGGSYAGQNILQLTSVQFY
ncbi:hypothetical protein [Peredibacter starrii]|uniref:Lipoprotein n=1 Tax=Peredibacter starrii TaxID=28202 RepID=A0AAX4HPA5_9BACT|nr:hypothetical protein [Peredibacter starrii]WPU65170.1 hypothetical protein SOO65_00205 [Peredibacter starrii]